MRTEEADWGVYKIALDPVHLINLHEGLAWQKL